MRIFYKKKITPSSVNLKVAMRYPYVFKEQKMEFISFPIEEGVFFLYY